MMLLTWVNLAYYQELMAGMRAAIAENRFDDFRRQTREGWRRGLDAGPADSSASAPRKPSGSNFARDE